MRPLALAITIAAAIALPAQAVAQVPATRTMPVSANAPFVCAMAEPKVDGGGQINFKGLNGNTLQIDRMVDPTTLAVMAASANVSFDAVCNSPHRIRIETQNNGLWRTSNTDTAPPPGFAFAVPYSATMDWGLEHRTIEADGKVRRIAENTFNVERATSGEFRLRIELLAGASNVQANAPLLAGQYADTLRITLEPK